MSRLERLRNKRDKLSWKLRECERQIEEEERKERYRDYRPASASGTVRIASLMPGKIISVNVSEGDYVKKGDVLLVVEAMKMENDIIAPRNGRVVQMIAKQGDIVEHGNVLVEMEP